MDSALDNVRQLLGLGRDISDVNAFQMALRTNLIYMFALAIIRLACMEQNGRISVVRARRAPHAVDVSVDDGVKTVRIELG